MSDLCQGRDRSNPKLSIGSGAARIFCHKVAYHLLMYAVANLWANMMVTREGGEENKKEDTAFGCLQGELSVYAENFSDSFF